jgi:hypothetical protein
VLLVLVASSVLVNAVIVGGFIVLATSATARSWTADQLDLARSGELTLAANAAASAGARADEARLAAEVAATKGDLGAVQSAVSDVDLRVSALESRVADQQADLDAACDWARLQQTNFAGSSLVNVFFDYAQSVCLD